MIVIGLNITILKHQNIQIEWIPTTFLKTKGQKSLSTSKILSPKSRTD